MPAFLGHCDNLRKTFHELPGLGPKWLRNPVGFQEENGVAGGATPSSPRDEVCPTGRDARRVRVLREQAKLDLNFLADVLKRHQREEKWKLWTE